ncbi:MAG TPA: NifB/NifX family molybdenum-iron cluster-binding protein [Syntrophales bacterium]|nr:NifB/NifX family molybdenum-iron cluster-binding protein [Syntrophales bacterium]
MKHDLKQFHVLKHLLLFTALQTNLHYYPTHRYPFIYCFYQFQLSFGIFLAFYIYKTLKGFNNPVVRGGKGDHSFVRSEGKSGKELKIGMKIAVPLFGERVSPHFGSSSKFMIVEFYENVIRERVVCDVGENGPMELARRMVDMEVKTLLCGGIERSCKEWLIHRGVHVVENQKGYVDEVIAKIIE